MKTNLIYSLLPSYFFKKIKAFQKSHNKESTTNSNAFKESLNAENALVSKINKEIEQISVIAEQVYGDKTDLSSLKKDNFKILLVEDNVAHQTLISGLLKKEKYQCDIVKNGWEAICAFEASKYDLILMDINLPILDGEEATKAIRKTNKQIPILALTADEICNELFEDKLYMGFNDVISKPINHEVFMTTIKNLIALTKRSFPFTNGIDGVTLAS